MNYQKWAPKISKHIAELKTKIFYGVFADPANDSVIYKTFGHGEWGDFEGSDILQLEPIKYLNSKGLNLALYISNYAWEGDDRCLLNLEIGWTKKIKIC